MISVHPRNLRAGRSDSLPIRGQEPAGVEHGRAGPPVLTRLCHFRERFRPERPFQVDIAWRAVSPHHPPPCNWPSCAARIRTRLVQVARQPAETRVNPCRRRKAVARSARTIRPQPLHPWRTPLPNHRAARREALDVHLHAPPGPAPAHLVPPGVDERVPRLFPPTSLIAASTTERT